MSDPAEQLQGNQQPGDGAGGTSTPSGDDEVARLKRENAELREGRRKDRADSLGATHGLTKTQIELLAGQPADKQEEIAKRLEEERKGQAPAATTPAPPAEPASPQQGTTPPASQPDLSAPSPEERKQAAFSDDSGQTPPPPVAQVAGSAEDRFNAAMSNAETFEEMTALQQKYRNELREERVARDRGQK